MEHEGRMQDIPKVCAVDTYRALYCESVRALHCKKISTRLAQPIPLQAEITDLVPFYSQLVDIPYEQLFLLILAPYDLDIPQLRDLCCVRLILSKYHARTSVYKYTPETHNNPLRSSSGGFEVLNELLRVHLPNSARALCICALEGRLSKGDALVLCGNHPELSRYIATTGLLDAVLIAAYQIPREQHQAVIFAMQRDDSRVLVIDSADSPYTEAILDGLPNRCRVIVCPSKDEAQLELRNVLTAARTVGKVLLVTSDEQVNDPYNLLADGSACGGGLGWEMLEFESIA
jgi:hypothetical protein